MNFETRERIESLLDSHSITNLKENINDIANDLLDDGFTYKDVKEYIIEKLDEILGYDNKD
jgi:uncharacterized protein (UPF0335 family)